MELDFDLSSVAIPGCLLQFPIAILEKSKIQWAARKMRQESKFLLLGRGIDTLGRMSAEAQLLKRPLTSFERFLDSRDEQVLYLLWDVGKKCGDDGTLDGEAINGAEKELLSTIASNQNRPSKCSVLLGYIKIMRDCRLYLVNERGRRFIHTPICILDFYIHESVQHHGRSLELFNAMLKSEHTTPRECAYDKPSPAFLHFLQQHFGLQTPVWQPTSIAVFGEFFNGLKSVDAEKNDSDDELHPLRATERNKRSINEHYNGTSPVESARHHTPRDLAAEIIHCAGQLPVWTPLSPDTPQGRKTTRDYGHQKIW